MTLSYSNVRNIWETEIFENDDIIAITENILDYEYSDESQFEVSRLYKLDSQGIGRINFFEYIIEIRSETVIEVNGGAYPEREITVDVRYTKELDTEGEAETDVKEAIETVLSTVKTELGSSWSTLEVRTDPVITIGSVTREEVNQTLCVRQIATFRAFRQ